MTDHLSVRSYRRVFRLERRLYRIDRWRIPRPGGIPLRGVAYFAIVAVLVALLSRVPGTAQLLGVLNAPLRYVILPSAVAVLILHNTDAMDGRSPHAFVFGWLRGRLHRRPPAETQWAGRMGVRWDGESRRNGRDWTVASTGGDR